MPALLEYELINGLVITRKRGRLAESAVTSALGAFQRLGIRLFDPSGHYDRIAWYCHTYARSGYDACYLALAEQEGVPLITAPDHGR